MATKKRDGTPTNSWFKRGCYRKRDGKIVFRKQRYEDFLTALLAARRTANEGYLRNSGNIVIYECPLCGYAHLGRAGNGTVLMYDGWKFVVGGENDDSES